MTRPQSMFLILSLIPMAAFRCLEHCNCSGTVVDCSGQMLNLSTLPKSFAATTTQIHLKNNKLFSIPNGLFDNLQSLRSISLDNNPWVCDCNILYLRSWLLNQDRNLQDKNIMCYLPVELRGRRILYLTEDEIVSTCQNWYCTVALICQIGLFIFIIVQAILLLLVIIFLRRFEGFSKAAIVIPKGDNFKSTM
uniref:Glycoprotein Ib platelet subunit beta n=1 Tax=Callorhinchus milii TaxID=7868 RepID=A0A4W3IW33_CALMI